MGQIQGSEINECGDGGGEGAVERVPTEEQALPVSGFGGGEVRGAVEGVISDVQNDQRGIRTE